jgi:hypothetical protein
MVISIKGLTTVLTMGYHHALNSVSYNIHQHHIMVLIRLFSMLSSYDLNFGPLHGHHHYGLALVLTLSRSMVNIMVIMIIIWTLLFIIKHYASIHDLFIYGPSHAQMVIGIIP